VGYLLQGCSVDLLTSSRRRGCVEGAVNWHPALCVMHYVEIAHPVRQVRPSDMHYTRGGSAAVRRDPRHYTLLSVPHRLGDRSEEPCMQTRCPAQEARHWPRSSNVAGHGVCAIHVDERLLREAVRRAHDLGRSTSFCALPTLISTAAVRH
jgi:hypothetical protein